MTLHDVEVLALEDGPMISMPSPWVCPDVAEQPAEPNSVSHAGASVSPDELFLPLPKFYARYWSGPGRCPACLVYAACELQRLHWVPPSTGTALEADTKTFPGGPWQVILIGKLPAAPGCPTQHCPFG